MDETLSTSQLARLAGCQEHTINYWRNQEVISPIGDKNPGSGYQLEWDPNLVPVVKMLVKIENYFKVVSCVFLKEIVKNFDKGRLELDEGIVLTWPAS